MGTIFQRNLLVALAAALLWTMAAPKLIPPLRRAVEQGIVLSVLLPGDVRADIRIGRPSEVAPLPEAVPDPCVMVVGPARRRT